MITLRTLHEATPQAVFDQVGRHLLTQNAQAVDEFGCCAYRGEDGLSCAVGCLIGDDEYTEGYEDLGVGALIDVARVREVLAIQPSLEIVELLQSLQGIHDNIAPENWGAALVDQAGAFGLSATIVGEMTRQGCPNQPPVGNH